MAEIDINDVHKYYGANHVLKGVTFEVYEGNRVGLLGKNGAGKTTLFKIIAGSENFESGYVNVTRGKRIGILDQIPEYPNQYTTMDVLKSAFKQLFKLKEEMMELEGIMTYDSNPVFISRYGELQTKYEAMGGYTIDSSITRVCIGLGINQEMQEKSFSLLSGGEKTRVNLGRIILQDMDVLLMDEPTNHLDIKSIEWLEEFLGQYKGTIVVISHDRFFLDRVVNKIIEIENGKAFTYEGNYSSYVKEKEERYQIQLAHYEQEQKKKRQLEEAAKRLHEWARNADNKALHKRAFAIEKRIEKMDNTEKPVKEKMLATSFRENGFSGMEVISLQDVSKAYEGRLILNSVNLNVHKGERIALLGENGCGKTTLLKVLTGELEVDSGTVRTGGSIKYAYLPQIVVFEDVELSVLDTVRNMFKVNEGKVRNMLASFNFKNEDVYKKVGALSGGERSRLRLCMLMQQDVNLLILDEPTNHLDIASREWIEKTVENFEGTILFVSHDRYFINRYAARILELNAGKITDYYGLYEEYRQWKSKNEFEKTRDAVKQTSKTKKIYDSQREKDSVQNRKKELEDRIIQMEERIKKIDMEMEKSACDYEYLNTLYMEKQQLSAEIEASYSSWCEIQD